MEVTVVTLTFTVVVQTDSISRFIYVEVTLLIDVAVGRLMVVVVLHIEGGSNWRFKPLGGCDHSAVSGRFCTTNLSNRMFL
jgi:hypothetical protein